jgi:hypothetical protein
VCSDTFRVTHDDTAAADETLAARYARLNHEFYTADPADYFHVRWLALVLLAGRAGGAIELFKDGVTYGNVVARIDDASIDPDGIRDYVTIESQVLMHQASETLIRLFFAHAGRPECPWLEVARETNFALFKARVRTQLLECSTLELTAVTRDVFLSIKPSALGLSTTDVDVAVANVTGFLTTLARRWLDEAHAYNSLKHGLAVVPSATSLSFTAEGTNDARLMGEGPTMAYLESERDGTHREWKQTTRWLDVNEALALTQVARQMIDSLWQIGRARYDSGPKEVRLFVPVGINAQSFRTPGRLPAKSCSMSVGIADVVG